MVRALSHDRTGARGDRRHAQWQGQNREAQRRRESADRGQVRHPVDPDADDLQGGPACFAPDRRGAEAEAGAVDHRGGLSAALRATAYLIRPLMAKNIRRAGISAIAAANESYGARFLLAV